MSLAWQVLAWAGKSVPDRIGEGYSCMILKCMHTQAAADAARALSKGWGLWQD
jgi:hypothetical protein